MRRFAVLGVLAVTAAVGAAPASAATPEFGPPLQISPTPAFGVGVGLFDAGAAPDALLTPGALNPTNVQAVLGKGDGTFFGPADVTGAGQVERPAIADLDADGDVDVVIGSTGGMILLTGNGLGGFTSGPVGPPTYVTDVAIGDVTGDGRPDLVATTFADSVTPTTLLVLRREANGTYTSVAQGLVGNSGTGPRSVALADLDRDGDLDAITGNSNGIVWVQIGNNSGNFATRAGPFNATDKVDDMLAADLDRDGDVDIATASTSAGVVVLKGNGTTGAAALTPTTPIPTGINTQWVATADLDGDGVLDLAATSSVPMQPGRVSILRGLGDATYEPPANIALAGTGTPGLAIADANGDDRPDLWLAPSDNPPQVRLNASLFPQAIVTTGTATDVTQTTATLNGTVDADGRRGAYQFEYGLTTAYGNVTPLVPLAITGDPQPAVAAITGLTPGTTYHFRVLASTAAAGLVGAADGTFTTPPVIPTTTDAIALTRSSFNVKWKVSKPSGEVVVRGTAREAGKVRFRLLRDLGKGRTRQVASYSATIAAGNFTRRLKVPAAILPGKHVVTLEGTVGTLQLIVTSRNLTLPAPPEGIVGQAFASSVRNGPPALRLPGRRTQAHANFVFKVRPKKGRAIVARWFLPSGRALDGVPKANATRVGAVVSSRSALPAGRWRCELRVRGVLVAVVRVRIG